jgi:hypothetical protein
MISNASLAKILLVTIVLVLSQSALGQARNNTISGHVFGISRQPLVDVYVELLNEVNSVVARVKTTSGGRYFFGGLSGGAFVVRVSPYGTDMEGDSVEIVIGGASVRGRAPAEAVQQDFYLRLKRNSAEQNSLTGTVFAQEVPDNAKRLYDQAILLIAEKRNTEASEILEKSLVIFPEFYLSLIRLGQEYGAVKSWEQSKALFKRSTIVNPRSFVGFYGLASSSLEIGDLETSIAAANSAISINGNSFEAYLLLGQIQRRSKLYSESLVSMLKANSIADGKSSEIHWHLALLYAHNLGKFGKAADHLESYLKLNKKSTETESIRKLIKQFRSQEDSITK